MAYSLALREACEPRLMTLPEVSARAMFGAHCYLVRGRMFVIVTGESICLRPARGDEPVLVGQFGAEPWTPRPGMKFGRWFAVRCDAGAEGLIAGLAPYLENACEARRRDVR